jgi:hypothetical protein
MNLPSGVRNPTNAMLLKISEQEKARGRLLEEQYWLFFDVKEGLVPEKFARMGEDDKAWILSKAQLAGIDPTESTMPGYGDKVIGQLFAENKFKSELRRETRHHIWRSVFGSFLDELIWVFAAGRKVIT